MFDALHLIYYSWLSKGDKVLYKDDVKEIMKKFEISKEGKASIRAIQQTLALKNMTDAGKDRKKRMWTKLFYEKDKLCLYSNMFLAVLPLQIFGVCFRAETALN